MWLRVEAPVDRHARVDVDGAELPGGAVGTALGRGRSGTRGRHLRVAYLVTEGRRLQDGELQVFDVWESQAAFDAFGQTLMPILQEVGVDPGQPMVERIHVING